MSTTKKLNRGLALALILALVLCLLPVAAHAFSGTGTQSDPYIIANASDLATFRSNVNGGTSYSGVYFKLTADITTAQTAVIGTSSTYPFAGTFDGDGHTINVNLSGASRTALFGYVTGTIKNLKVTGSVTSSGSYSGGVVGYLNGGSVLNCGNEASVSATGGYSAGVVGYTGGTCTIDGCYNKGAISGGTRIGGVVGEQYTNVTVSNCYNMASVTGTSSANGGVVGYSRGPVSNCYHAVGTISSSSNGASKGAIIGYMYSSGSMSNCYYVATTSGLQGNSAGTAGTELTVAQMKAAASSLGNYYEADSNSINSGYPILYWQGSGNAPSNTTVTALNNLINTNATSIKAYHESTYTNAYSNNDTISDNYIYLKNFYLDAQNSGINAEVNTVWTSSSSAVTIPSSGNGEATVTHSTTEALSVTLTAYLTAVVDNVTYTSTDYVRYSFTISRDLGEQVTRTVYVSIFNKAKSNPEVTGTSSRQIIAVPVTVSGYSNTICVDDALQQVHTTYFNGNGTGYATNNGMITTLWGITNNNNFAIYRNNTLTNAVTVEPIADGDLITAFPYNSSSYGDRFLYFSSASTSMPADSSTTLTLAYKTYSNQTGTSITLSPTIYKMNENDGTLSTSSDLTYTKSTGLLTASQNAFGTYVLVAKKNVTIGTRYVPAVAIVKVGLSDAASIAADKTALTITTGANNTVVSYVELPTSGANGTTITWSSSPAGIIASNGLVTRPAQNTQVTLTATISKGNATPDTKLFYVTVPAKVASYSTILPTLTTTLTPNSVNVTSSNIEDYIWDIMDVIAFEMESGNMNDYISASEKASYYNYVRSFAQSVISGSASNTQKSSDLAKAIIVLKAIDYDDSGTNSGYSVENQPITYNNTTKTLKGWMEDYANADITAAQASINNSGSLGDMISYLPTASFILVADLEEHTATPSSFQTSILNLFVSSQSNGKWSDYIDIDAVVLAALGFYDKEFSGGSGVQSAISSSASYLSSKQLDNGSFGLYDNSTIGNVNSTAFVLIGLTAAGQNATGPAFTKNSTNTAVSGLLTFYNNSTGRFQDNGVDNDLATEQAYRALVAWDGYYHNNNSFVVYEF